MEQEDVRPWWQFWGGPEGGSWACGRQHPVYDGDTCKRMRFHRGQHLHPDTGYWFDEEESS